VKRTADAPISNRASGDCRTPILPNKQDTLREGSKQSGRKGSVRPMGLREGGLRSTNKKRKVLDMANKKRNNLACFEVGYVSSSFLHGSDPWYPAPPR
jgi:hypothetical protein